MALDEVVFSLCSGIFELCREFTRVCSGFDSTFFKIIRVDVDTFLVSILRRHLFPDLLDLTHGGHHTGANYARQRLCQTPYRLRVGGLIVGRV